MADKIRADVEASEADFRSGVQHAIAAGESLIEAKSLVPHGGWGAWLAVNFDGGQRTAQIYMKLAANANRVSHLLKLREAIDAVVNHVVPDEREPKPKPKSEPTPREELDDPEEEIPAWLEWILFLKEVAMECPRIVQPPPEAGEDIFDQSKSLARWLRKQAKAVDEAADSMNKAQVDAGQQKLEVGV